MTEACAEFRPYVARDRFFRDIVFDFHIENETGRSWYDGSPNQYMQERAWCMGHIKPGFNVVDCGAHHGMMAVLFSRATGPTGRVIAYEALPTNAAVIAKNIVLNGCTNVNVRAVGLGERPGKLAFSHNASNVVALADILTDGDERVEIVRLDDDLPTNLGVDFIKLDVEGHELEALRGMSRVLRQRPLLDVELHNFLYRDRMATIAAISDILMSFGYRFQLMPEISDQPSAPVGRLDVAWLANFHNPHVLCLPTRMSQWKRMTRRYVVGSGGK